MRRKSDPVRFPARRRSFTDRYAPKGSDSHIRLEASEKLNTVQPRVTHASAKSDPGINAGDVIWPNGTAGKELVIRDYYAEGGSTETEEDDESEFAERNDELISNDEFAASFDFESEARSAEEIEDAQEFVTINSDDMPDDEDFASIADDRYSRMSNDYEASDTSRPRSTIEWNTLEGLNDDYGLTVATQMSLETEFDARNAPAQDSSDDEGYYDNDDHLSEAERIAAMSPSQRRALANLESGVTRNGYDRAWMSDESDNVDHTDDDDDSEDPDDSWDPDYYTDFFTWMAERDEWLYFYSPEELEVIDAQRSFGGWQSTMTARDRDDMVNNRGYRNSGHKRTRQVMLDNGWTEWTKPGISWKLGFRRQQTRVLNVRGSGAKHDWLDNGPVTDNDRKIGVEDTIVDIESPYVYLQPTIDQMELARIEAWDKEEQENFLSNLREQWLESEAANAAMNRIVNNGPLGDEWERYEMYMRNRAFHYKLDLRECNLELSRLNDYRLGLEPMEQSIVNDGFDPDWDEGDYEVYA
ncbi:MAG: hypothetical protein NUV56_00525 [Candidatus Uhrbacteria bacterium]|nr:hypothetical protein [Candidatus Uhrbacteria bacterium]